LREREREVVAKERLIEALMREIHLREHELRFV
jgi:hypothetical protein